MHSNLDQPTPYIFRTLRNENGLQPPTLRYVFFDGPLTLMDFKPETDSKKIVFSAHLVRATVKCWP